MAADDTMAADAQENVSPLFTLDRTREHLMEVDATVRSCLNWNYGERTDRVWSLYEKNKTAQWNAATDIDWSHDVRFGEPFIAGQGEGVASFVVCADSPVPPRTC